MARPPHPGPTPRELLLLKILWEKGPRTVRQIRAAFPERPVPAYTSLQTNLQAMHDKALVTRETAGRSHVYAAAVEREAVERNIVDDLLTRVFDGSALRLVTAALTTDVPSDDELERLKALIDARSKRG